MIQLLIHECYSLPCSTRAEAVDLITKQYQNIFNIQVSVAECHAWPSMAVMRSWMYLKETDI